jgi:hypothetical protein
MKSTIAASAEGRIAANDNVRLPRPVVLLKAAEEEAAIDRERERIEARQAVGEAWDGRRVSAWQTATRLLRAGRLDDLAALRLWRDLNEPLQTIELNDNDPELDEDGAPIPPSVDCTIQVRPSENELARAWLRPSIRLHSDGTVERAPARVTGKVVWSDGSVTFRCGDLRFDNRCRLTSWRDGDYWQRPYEAYRGARGGGSGAVTVDLPMSTAQQGAVGFGQEDEVARVLDAMTMRDELASKTSEILDLACTRATAEVIAIEALNANPGKYAERCGVRAIDEAITHFREWLVGRAAAAGIVPSNVSRAA